ncbi:hypothetical protein IKL64_02955 [bacterium]|nr:hypothetical protein [bacterium]
MKQKFLYLVLLLTSLVCSQAYAQTIEVKALEDISTANPSKTTSVQLLQPVEIKKDKFVGEGAVLNGNLIDVVSPKRLKRDADFAFEPKSYTDSEGKTRKIKAKIKASYTEPIDKKQVAKKTVTSAGNLFVQGFSMGVAAVEGAVKNQDGNRFKSSVSSVYEASPLSYARKGEDIEIKAGQVFFLKFPSYGKIDKEVQDANAQTSSGPVTVQGQNYSIEIEKE